MTDWCPLVGPIPAAWPAELQDIIIEARRILGAKAKRGFTIKPERVAELRTWYAAAPAWLACLLDARDAADEAATICPELALDLSPPQAPEEARSVACLLAIHAARQAALSTDRRATLAFLRAARDALAEAHAMGARAAIEGARTASADRHREPVEAHAIVLAEARALLAARPRPRHGLAGILAPILKRKHGMTYGKRQINRILADL